MITGIIAEYNPFHNGHLYQINKIREILGADTRIIACISGGITQRGELPILDKWQRAALAVQNGANLVLEIPSLFACRSAQHFAFGGVSLLHQLGVVDKLAFSTKYPDIDTLHKAASINVADQRDKLLSLLKQGNSYAAATAQIISDLTGTDIDILKEPNTILAIEYLKALKEFDSSIEIMPIKRMGTSHNDMEAVGEYASGTAIRKMVALAKEEELKKVVPDSTFSLISQLTSNDIGSLEKLYPTLQLKILHSSPEKLREIYSINEGIEYKLIEAASAPTLAEFTNKLIGKRYQRTRINRLIHCLLLDINKELMDEADNTGVAYIRALAFDNIGRDIIKKIKKAASIPVITKITQYINRRDFIGKNMPEALHKQLYYDIQYNNLYQLCQNAPKLNRDFTMSPVFIDRD
ncbi:nucleotidyltransferase family protein [Anaerovibrio sp. RM50]|uniref:tRNA(Met) cytidine acetate ligase n=1 Tax=Anaerovibrio sp. RM50 TaxID=1200557 RepID=UPI000687608D|nr:nucleotidyltransferase family protein [Anaerovibrio sp. RM50]